MTASPTSARAADGFADYQATARFDAIQELRTISVVLVVAAHMQDPLLHHVHGAVTVFFVVSGFIITTLFLREEARSGRVALRSFYLRRAFRLLPMYLLAFAAFATLILGLHLGGQVSDFRRALPYYLTYQNDLAPSAPFGQTWSLAIDEKFYLFWPVLIFAIPLVRRWRATIAVCLLAAAVVAQLTGHTYLATYAPILAGCLMALAMHGRRGFGCVRPLTHPVVTVVLVAGAVVAAALDGGQPENGHLLLTAAVTLALPGFILGRGWLHRLTCTPVLVRLGRYSYGVYLIHPLVKSCIDVVEPHGQSAIPVQLGRYVATLVLAFGAAAMTYHLVEAPLTERGRRLARGLAAPARSRRARALPLPAALDVRDPA